MNITCHPTYVADGWFHCICDRYRGRAGRDRTPAQVSRKDRSNSAQGPRIVNSLIWTRAAISTRGTPHLPWQSCGEVR
jgi:hypothetical protein